MAKSKKLSPYVHSGYKRAADDHYPTIDERCIYGLLEHVSPRGLCVDPCAPSGSGIVDTLVKCGYESIGKPDAFAEFEAGWIVSNPPYKRGVVDTIIRHQINRLVEGEVFGVAMLLRLGFDCAAKRVGMFRDCPFYYGQVRLMFRPWWSESRESSPIHNYVWHVWRPVAACGSKPVVMYASGRES